MSSTIVFWWNKVNLSNFCLQTEVLSSLNCLRFKLQVTSIQNLSLLLPKDIFLLHLFLDTSLGWHNNYYTSISRQNGWSDENSPPFFLFILDFPAQLESFKTPCILEKNWFTDSTPSWKLPLNLMFVMLQFLHSSFVISSDVANVKVVLLVVPPSNSPAKILSSHRFPSSALQKC